jgi:hypothetical protein
LTNADLEGKFEAAKKAAYAGFAELKNWRAAVFELLRIRVAQHYGTEPSTMLAFDSEPSRLSVVAATLVVLMSVIFFCSPVAAQNHP